MPRFTFGFSLGLLAVYPLVGCATSSVPSNFIYETSLRGEQGLIGRSERLDAASSLLEAGGVNDPQTPLRKALPNATVDVKQWGVKYFSSNWARYQTVLEANIELADQTVKCRLKSPETPVGAPTLQQLRAHDGAELERRLNDLVTACLAEVG